LEPWVLLPGLPYLGIGLNFPNSFLIPRAQIWLGGWLILGDFTGPFRIFGASLLGRYYWGFFK